MAGSIRAVSSDDKPVQSNNGFPMTDDDWHIELELCRKPRNSTITGNTFPHIPLKLRPLANIATECVLLISNTRSQELLVGMFSNIRLITDGIGMRD